MPNESLSDENLGNDAKVTDLIRRDHLRIQQMFVAYNLLIDNREKKLLVDKILDEIRIHNTVEEELIYPLVRAASATELTQAVMDEAEAEHRIAKDVMSELSVMKPGDDRYDAKVAGLYVLAKHHMNEEENEIFAEMRDADIDLEELGAEFLLRKEELMNSAAMKNIEGLVSDLHEFKEL